MKRTAMTKEERINARVQAMKAHRKNTQRKKAAPVIITSICAMALLAGGTVLGISVFNNNNAKSAQAVQPTVAAKNTGVQDATQKASAVRNNSAQNNSVQTNNTYVQNTDTYSQGYNTMPVYDEDTDSYSYSYDYTDYSNYSNYSDSKDYSDSSAQQAAATGTHHSGATWNGTGTPLHFTENGKTTYGYNWRYEGGNGLVDLGCDYTFDGSSYDFSLIGKEPGSGSITVWHNTGNNTQEPTTINFTVDDDLNVTYN